MARIMKSDMEKFLKGLESMKEGKEKQETTEDYLNRLQGILKDLLENPEYYDDLHFVIQVQLKGINENCMDAAEKVIKNPLARSGVVMAEAGTLIEFFSSISAIVETILNASETLYKSMSERIEQLEQENKELKGKIEAHTESCKKNVKAENKVKVPLCLGRYYTNSAQCNNVECKYRYECRDMWERIENVRRKSGENNE